MDIGPGERTAIAINSAIVLGATGNVGGRMVQLLVKNPLCRKLVVATRRKTSADNRIRRVDHVTGVIWTVAGNGSYSYSGDGGPALSAGIPEPHGPRAVLPLGEPHDDSAGSICPARRTSPITTCRATASAS
jgi:hypothetical protein